MSDFRNYLKTIKTLNSEWEVFSQSFRWYRP